MWVLYQGRNGIWKCLFFWREENRSTRRKTLRAGTRTDNKLKPHMQPGRNQTRATLVAGERSHRYAIPASCVRNNQSFVLKADKCVRAVQARK